MLASDISDMAMEYEKNAQFLSDLNAAFMLHYVSWSKKEALSTVRLQTDSKHSTATALLKMAGLVAFPGKS